MYIHVYIYIYIYGYTHNIHNIHNIHIIHMAVPINAKLGMPVYNAGNQAPGCSVAPVKIYIYIYIYI